MYQEENENNTPFTKAPPNYPHKNYADPHKNYADN